jgi:hypothetical protein
VVQLQLYRRKEDCVAKGQPERFQTKIELACRLIEQWQPPCGMQPFVLVDSWYVSDEVLASCAKRGFTLIGGVKANRSITTAKCPELTTLSNFAPKLPSDAYQFVTIGKQRFSLAAIEATLKSGQNVKLLVSRVWAKGADPRAGIKHYHYRYFVSSDTGLSVQTICELYAVRWEIETFHAHLKELLGFDHNQCRIERNVERLWTLVLIAYSYLMLEAVEAEAVYWLAKPKRQQLLVSLGEVVAEHKRQVHQGITHWVYAQAQAEQPLEQILAAFAA